MREPISLGLLENTVKALADKVALIDHLIFQEDLTLYVLNELRHEFHEIVVPIQAGESSLAFEELHDLLVGLKSYPLCLDISAAWTLQPNSRYSQKIIRMCDFLCKRFLKTVEIQEMGHKIKAQPAHPTGINVGTTSIKATSHLVRPLITRESINLIASSMNRWATRPNLALSYIRLISSQIVLPHQLEKKNHGFQTRRPP